MTKSYADASEHMCNNEVYKHTLEKEDVAIFVLSRQLDSKGSKLSNKDKTANMDQLLEEIRKDMKTTNVKQTTGNNSKNKSGKMNKQPLVNKVPTAQTDAAASLVKQMQL